MLKISAKILTRSLFLWQSRRKKTTFDPTSVKSILFVELTRLGDVVTILPTIHAFRSACPKAMLFVAVQSQYKELFQFIPAVDVVYGIDGSGSLGSFLNAVKQLQTQSFDLVCSMSPSSRNSLMTLCTTSKMKVGYFSFHDTMTPFLHISPLESIGVQLLRQEVYAMENITRRPQKVCTALGIPVQNNIQWNIPESRVRQMKEKLKAEGYQEEAPLILIHPFSEWNFRQWSTANFLTLAENLVKQHSGWVVLIGKEEEWEKVNTAACQTRRRIIRFSTLGVTEISVLITMASLFVGNDSGPLHLASSFGIPAIGLFGPAPPELTATESKKNMYIYHRVECSPCRQIQCVRPEQPCMSLITQEEVLQAAQTLLGRSNASR